METRSLTDIKVEIEATTERRATLWKELSAAPNGQRTSEVIRLNERLEELWTEAREAKSRARFGPQAAILRRARADERLERDLARVA